MLLQNVYLPALEIVVHAAMLFTAIGTVDILGHADLLRS